MELDAIWQKALATLEERLPLASFEGAVKQARPVTLDDNRIVIHTPNDFVRNWLMDRLAQEVGNALSEAAGQALNITYITDQALAVERPEERVTPARTDGEPERPVVAVPHNLNPKYTFDSFVVGNHSRFAHAAAMRVGEAPAVAYNRCSSTAGSASARPT